LRQSKLLMMQGRLVDAPDNQDLDWFPIKAWADEFSLASTLGINSIELVFDKGYNKENPLRSESGREKIREAFLLNRLTPYSGCLNFIIDNFITDIAVFDACVSSIEALSQLNVKFVILPLFGKSYIKLSTTIQQVAKLSFIASNCGMRLLIESNENAPNILALLKDKHLSNIAIAYDVGNASYCGHNVEAELLLLHEKIAHIHIKDKNIYGVNTLLGSGIVKFDSIFKSLLQSDYKGMFTLETCRGNNGLLTAKKNIQFMQKYL